MTCMSPIAPLSDTDFASTSLSARVTARSQATGIWKRRDASCIALATTFVVARLEVRLSGIRPERTSAMPQLRS